MSLNNSALSYFRITSTPDDLICFWYLLWHPSKNIEEIIVGALDIMGRIAVVQAPDAVHELAVVLERR